MGNFVHKFSQGSNMGIVKHIQEHTNNYMTSKRVSGQILSIKW